MREEVLETEAVEHAFPDHAQAPVLLGDGDAGDFVPLHQLEGVGLQDLELEGVEHHGVDRLVKVLRRSGIDAGALHGGKAQNARNRAIAAFKAVLEEHGLGSALTKFIIPAKETARFRDQLDLVDVDERRLFPGLDGVAAEMRRYYS